MHNSEQKGISNANSFISLLKEKDNDFKTLALNQLLSVVDYQWSDISGSLQLIQEISEDRQFQNQQLASYLCSKVYYHLGDMESALNQALLSGKYFNLDVRSQFNDCLITHCIDQYIKNRQKGDVVQDQKKEDLVVQIIEQSAKQGNLFSALGVSLDCERIDLVEQIISVPKGEFRESVLRKCVQILHSAENELLFDDWSNFISVLVKLGESNKVAEILWRLLGQNKQALAYQLAIDLHENQTIQFLNQLIAELPADENLKEKREKLLQILTGEVQRKAQLLFLQQNNQTDPHYLTQMKAQTEPKHSVPHGAALMSHAIMQTSTSDASFLKNNIEWATKCNYWQRFTTTATLGMIYKDNYEKCNEVLAPYMPQSGGAQGQGSTNVFENGGAFYALGLINQGTKKEEVILKLSEAIRNPQLNKSEQVTHGACLGLGLVAMASEDQTIVELLKEVLFKNESIYGEAAALSIGLVQAGSNNIELAQELLQFSRQSDKEKIIRQLGTSIALILFGQEEKADGFIDQMLSDSEPFVRYGGCLTLAMAYVGTASNKVIQKLLNQAVNDVSDDVRRISVISLAFVLFKNFEQIPKIMRLLILSYNPHIRYGTAIALGIACAGTMYSEAISMLEPMLSDNVDFVRQGALIAMSLVMMQANNNCEPKFEQFRKTITDIQAKKHETVLVKLGVFISQGILDAGGRNLIVSLQSKSGFAKLISCASMLVFTSYWYWFPMLPFLSLTFTPAALIGINENMAIPKQFQWQSNSKPTQFGYPPHIKADEKKVLEKKTVTLSTTNKVRARQVRRENERQGGGESSIISLRQGESQMSLEQQQSFQELHKHHSVQLQTNQDENKMKIEEASPKKEDPVITICNNPSRVLEKQKKHIQYIPNQRYEPLFKDRKIGFLILIDSKPDEAEEGIELFVKPKPKIAPLPQPIIAPQAEPQYQQLDEEFQVPEGFIYDEKEQK